MDSKFLRYYDRELQHLREMGGEFAKAFPKIAGRLALDEFECADPYVERLLEGFAFLAARVQLKIDSEFPRFTQHLLESVYPQYLSPTPSMALVQLQPDRTEGSLADGFGVPRGSAMRSMVGKGDRTPCEYRTAHDVTLWPLEVIEAEYMARSVGTLGFKSHPKAAIRIRLKTTAGVDFSDMSLDRLQFHIRGASDLPVTIYEQLFAHATGFVVRPTANPPPWEHHVARTGIRRVGYEDNQSLLPAGPRNFHGYRLLQEYFHLPERFLFVEFTDLQPAVVRHEGSELDLIILLDQSLLELEGVIDKSFFNLFCTPAINLFPKRVDRIHLTQRESEQHVVPDRTRPIDFEIHSITEVAGYEAGNQGEQMFKPFYACNDLDHGRAYFAVNRQPRTQASHSSKKRRRTSYPGSEIFLSLVDGNAAPYRSNLRQLGIKTLCTNRDLPLTMPVGNGPTDFTMESGAPIESVRCISGPTKPQPSHAVGQTAWRLINHLSLNYLSLVDSNDSQGAAALRDLLMLYGNTADAAIRKQVDPGIKTVRTQPVTRRVPVAGPVTFARGLEISITLDEAGFEGTGAFMLGSVLEQFFDKYVSINSFTETVVKTVDRGEIMRWPARMGRRSTL